MKKIAILTTEYMPPISSFWLMNNSDKIIIEHCENYQKKSTRNRSKILGVNGVDVLSVPLKKGKIINTVTNKTFNFNILDIIVFI